MRGSRPIAEEISRRCSAAPLLEGLRETAFRYLEEVREGISWGATTESLFCLVVLEDDLSDILEECERLLLQAQPSSSKEYEALEVRATTVFEEVGLFFSDLASQKRRTG